MKKLGFAWLLAAALGACAALGSWVFLVNRWAIHFVDSTAKNLAIAGLGVGLAAAAALPLCFGWFRRSVKVSLVVVLLLGADELHRAFLDSAYGAEPAGSDDAARLLHPVTTTDLEIFRFQAKLPGLAVPRLRVLHVTDLHIGEDLPYGYFERVQAEVLVQSPDLIVMTGDYIAKVERLPLLERWVAGLPKARYGTFAVLGNHDHWTLAPERVERALTNAGVELVRGTCKEVELSPGAQIRVCGSEAPWGPKLPPEALATTGADRVPVLVLSHTPDNVYDLAELGADAVFAGHTHGGQVRFPGLGALIVPSHYGRRFDRGHFLVGRTHLFVSAGVGADDPPIRLFCPPQLLVVDFVPPAHLNSSRSLRDRSARAPAAPPPE